MGRVGEDRRLGRERGLRIGGVRQMGGRRGEGGEAASEGRGVSGDVSNCGKTFVKVQRDENGGSWGGVKGRRNSGLYGMTRGEQG
jgi:hypothetical protein